jgi:acyl-CoA thioesterase-1
MIGAPVLPSSPPRPGRSDIVFLGDSLTAGYGVDERSAFPALIQAAWKRRGIPYTAVNEGLSGDTTADVIARMDASRGPRVELTVLEIGANDAFQAVPVRQVETNLSRIVRTLKDCGSRVVLSSMYFGEGFLPAGSEYTREFNAMYVHVGKAEDVPVLPPLLRSLYDRPSLWQNDGIHPTAEGHALIARDLLADLNPEWKE